jgi:hypothetical protein
VAGWAAGGVRKSHRSIFAALESEVKQGIETPLSKARGDRAF